MNALIGLRLGHQVWHLKLTVISLKKASAIAVLNGMYKKLSIHCVSNSVQLTKSPPFGSEPCIWLCPVDLIAFPLYVVNAYTVVFFSWPLKFFFTLTCDCVVCSRCPLIKCLFYFLSFLLKST